MITRVYLSKPEFMYPNTCVFNFIFKNIREISHRYQERGMIKVSVSHLHHRRFVLFYVALGYSGTVDPDHC
jgi:hypothetical protein